MEFLHYFGAALGLGLVVIGAGLGIGKLAAQVIVGGLGISFLSDVVSPGRLGSTGAALRDTWLSPSNMERNQAVIEKNLGRFAFDTGLMVAGGLGGAFLGRQLYPKLPLWEGASTRLEMPKAATSGNTSGKNPFAADVSRRPGPRRQPDLEESIDWTNKVNIAKQPDGSLTCQFGRLDKMGRRLVTRQPDGVEITNYWDGAQKVKHVDGTAITTYEPSGTRLRKTVRPDGSWLLEYRDGRQVSSKY